MVRSEEALGLFRGLQQHPLEGVCGVSPARQSVLVRFDPLHLTHDEVEGWIRSVPVGGREAVGKLVEILTLYIGEDLEEVASCSGCSTTEVVERHAGREYDAWFLGFVPGFAYLGEVDERIAVPRRSVARKAVPAGSVGIAGRQTGVYPRSTPGGWNLIGRTSAVLFDVATGKSLIEPGDRVRFVPE
jgi:KipI family sensor histidine kinase inhibitor